MKQISKLKELATDDRGVSPVIGVILMVAITVILAAVIASFVLGFGGSVSSNASAGVDVSVNETSGNATVTVISLGDNTDRVVCIQEDGTENGTAGSVGASASCGIGDNVVAVGTGNTNNATIRTNIGN